MMLAPGISLIVAIVLYADRIFFELDVKLAACGLGFL